MNTLDRKFQSLSEDELKALAPSIFTDHAADRTSEKYSYTSTYHIIQDLLKFGWVPVRAIERRVKRSFNIGFQKHTVYFRHPEYVITDGEGNVESYPEICLINSHDGLNAFRFSLALFRLACSNGLVFQSHDLGSNRIIHKGYNFNELESVIKKTVERIPFLIDRIEIMKSCELSEEEVHDYILQAIALREKYSQGVVIKVDPKEVDLPLRDDDKANNLWIVYNRIQEKLIKGGFKNLDNNRKLKQVQFLDKILWINKDLWELTTEWLVKLSTPDCPPGPRSSTIVPNLKEKLESFKDKVLPLVREGKSIPEICTLLNVSKKKYYSNLSDQDKEEISQLRILLKEK